MANLTLTIDTGLTYDRLASKLDLKSSDHKQNLPKIANLLNAMAAGTCDFTSGLLDISKYAKGLITFTAAAVNNETLTINDVTFTAKTSGAVAANGEFDLSSTVATQAANLVAAVNASVDSKIDGVITASVFNTYIASITSTGAASNNETFELNGVTFTAKSSGAVAANGEFDVSATPATQATNILAAIQAVADTRVNGVVTAYRTAGVVTIVAIDNTSSSGLNLTEACSNVTASNFALADSGIVVLQADYPGKGALGYTLTESMTGTAVTAFALTNGTTTTL